MNRSTITPGILGILGILGLVALTTIACDPQAGPDYQGDALAVIKGTVSNELATPPAGAEAMLVWLNSSGSPDIALAEKTDVTGDFPASFQLEVFNPPPVEYLNDATNGGQYPDETRIGVAYMMAVRPGIEPEELDEEAPLGVAEHHILVYVESDVNPGTRSEEFLGGQLEAGFHLMDVIRVELPTCDDEIFDCLVPAADGFDTQVPIRIANPDDLDFPNWT